MRVQSIGLNTYNRGIKANNVAKNNIAFTSLVLQTANDSYSNQVQSSLTTFIDYMKNLVTDAQNEDKEAQQHLKDLVGAKAASKLYLDKTIGYTEECDKKATKLLPLSGQGSRGAKIRKMITDALGLEPTNKTIIPLPAVIGQDEDGENIYLTTANNELLHMMQAGVLSPFEDIKWINTEKSEGDATVLIQGLHKGIIPTDRPAVFSYTDDVGTKGHLDYSQLMQRYNETANSDTEVIVRGFMEDREAVAGNLGCFLPNEDGTWAVYEKPQMEELDEVAPDMEQIPTNIGKTLFTPKGLKEIKSRIKDDADVLSEDNYSLTKYDEDKKFDGKGNVIDKTATRRWHVTEGILKPAGQRGVLDVIEKTGQFRDIGNGAAFSLTMADIAHGTLSSVFPAYLEEQVRDNVEHLASNNVVELNYDGQYVELPTID